jgi:hypothetical protein
VVAIRDMVSDFSKRFLQLEWCLKEKKGRLGVMGMPIVFVCGTAMAQEP